MEYQHMVAQLSRLVYETIQLWDPGWVTFNWRGYTYDHVQRVKGLALTLCAREGGDPEIVELAALLHDLTKPYDGEYQVDSEGKRVVDAQGYWRNELRPPARRNQVSTLYDRLGLAGQLHNESGAVLAERLLEDYGVEAPRRARVAEVIHNHLRPPDDADIESRCLYDADTVDANIGLPAFVRNIYINLYFYDQRKAPDAPPLEAILNHAPVDFLRPYVREKLIPWAAGKQRDFIPRLLTPSARALSVTRIERLLATFEDLSAELDNLDGNLEHGGLALVLYFMRHRDDPSIAAEVATLQREWLPTARPTPAAQALLARLQREMEGIE